MCAPCPLGLATPTLRRSRVFPAREAPETTKAREHSAGLTCRASTLIRRTSTANYGTRGSPSATGNRVDPKATSTSPTAGHRRDDRDGDTVGCRSAQTVGEPHVLVTDVHVDEAADLAVVVEHPTRYAGVCSVDVVEDVGERRAIRSHFTRAAGQLPEDDRDADRDTHRGPALIAAS